MESFLVKGVIPGHNGVIPGQKRVISGKSVISVKKCGPGKGSVWQWCTPSQTRHVRQCRLYPDSRFLKHPKGVNFGIFAILTQRGGVVSTVLG